MCGFNPDREVALVDNSRIHLASHMLAILIVCCVVWVVIWRFVALGTGLKIGLCMVAYVVVAFLGHRVSPRVLGPLLERWFPTSKRG